MSRRALLVVAVASVLALLGALAAQAASSTDVQANSPQVSTDPGSDTTAVFPTNKQNEPTIAVSPVDSSYLIAGSNDEQLQPPCGPGAIRGLTAPANDCSFFPNVGTDGVYTSSDGGTTWTNRGLLPGFSDAGGPLISDGDPVIVYGPKPDGKGGFSYANGPRAYYSSLASYATGQATGGQTPELLSVSTSDDDGVSWSDPVIAAKANGYVFNDKETIWADDNPDSPFFGRVYVSWTQFRDIPGCAEPIMTAYSADGGATWSRPKQLSPSQNCGLGGRQGSVIRTAANGTVYAVWEDSDINGSKQVVAISRNGGVSWTRPTTIAHVNDISSNGDKIPGSNFRIDSFASLAVDQSSGAAYVAWAQLSGTGSTATASIVVSKSADGGMTWSTPVAASNPADGFAFFQGLDVAPNGRIDLAYQAQKTTDPTTYGTGNATIDSYYTSSSDGGATWSTSTKVSTASSDPAASAQNNLARQFWGDYNTLVSTDSAAWFIYTDSRSGAGCAAVDAYQHAVDGSGPAAVKPAPENDCPNQQFGNSDAYVSVIAP